MSIVPAKRKYVAPGRVNTMKVDETFSIDSGMGGSFTVEYKGHWNGIAKFKNVNFKDWPYEYDIPMDKVQERIFILVPDYDSPTW